MNRKFFQQLLTELDPAEAAQHSTIHHHTEGMDYLCLHRSDKLTAKLYFIEPHRIAEAGRFLVTPHSHRYAFHSVVLAGMLSHARFNAVDGRDYERFSYHAETRTRQRRSTCDLMPASVKLHTPTCEPDYWVEPDDIHTLLAPYVPVLLGLVQFGDLAAESDVFIKSSENGCLEFPESRRPTAMEVVELRRRAKYAIHNGELK